MTRAIRFLKRAERDIETIGEFLGRDTPGRASRAVDMLVRRMRALPEFPEMGVSVGGGLRQMVFRDQWDVFVIRYRVDADAIVITRIWHGKQDRPK